MGQKPKTTPSYPGWPAGWKPGDPIPPGGPHPLPKKQWGKPRPEPTELSKTKKYYGPSNLRPIDTTGLGMGAQNRAVARRQAEQNKAATARQAAKKAHRAASKAAPK